jgi:hypothetical protein
MSEPFGTDHEPDPSEPANTSFSTILPTLQTAWDSTSIGEGKFCWWKYKTGIIDGYEPVDTNVHLRFGSEYHHAFEFYDHLKAEGESHRQASEAVISDALQRTWDKKLSRPWPSEDQYKNRGTLLRSISWYLVQFENDPLETLILDSGQPAVELHFDVSLGYQSRLTGEEFRLVGHLDKIAMFEGRPAIVDRKTTKFQITQSYFARFNPDNQVSTYIVGGNSILTHQGRPVLDMIIDAAQVMVHSTRFQRGAVGRTTGQLDEWLMDLFSFFEDAEKHAEQNHWPRNDKACGLPHTDPKTGETRYGCPFRQVGAADPPMRELLLRANFNKRTWDPSKPRELVRTP